MSSNTKWVDVPLLQPWELVNAYQGGLDYRYLSSGLTLNTRAPASITGTVRKSGLKNWLPRKSGDGVILEARDGLVIATTVVGKGTSVTEPRGIWWMDSIGLLVELWNTTAYALTGVDTYTTQTGWGAATSGPGGSTNGFDSSNNNYAFISTVSQSATVNSSGVFTLISDSDFPSSIVPMPVFLDSYVFVAQYGTRKIFNSDAGNPTSWQASTFISTEDYSGVIVGLARHHNTLVAFCTDHIEFFQDAGIPSPNSPLKRIQEKTSRIGCINRATIAVHGNVIYFAGIDSEGSKGIFKIENWEVKKVSTPSIDAVVRAWGGSGNKFGHITSWAALTVSANSTPYNLFATGYMMPMKNKWYYVFLPAAGIPAYSGGITTGCPSFLYDPELNLWMEIGASFWHSASTSGFGGWPFPYATYTNETLSGSGVYSFMLQNALGGSDDNHLAALTSTVSTGEVIDIENRGFKTGVTPSCDMIIQTAPDSYGVTGRIVVDGIEAYHVNVMSPAITTWGQQGTTNALLAVSNYPLNPAIATTGVRETVFSSITSSPGIIETGPTMSYRSTMFVGTQPAFTYQIGLQVGQLHALRIRLSGMERS